MIELKAISVKEETEVECELIKLSLWIHPEDHNKVTLNIYLEIRNIGDITLDEIILHFSPSTKIKELEDKTDAYTEEYRKLIGANLQSRNHPAEYLLRDEKSKEVVISFIDPIQPKELGSTLVKMELECNLDKASFLKKIITQKNAWKFGLLIWNWPGTLKRNQKLLDCKEEDIWIMIPKSLYREPEFLQLNPPTKYSQPLHQDDIENASYDKEMVYSGTLCLNWNTSSNVSKNPRGWIYSVQHITQHSPSIPLISLFALMAILLSLSMDIGSKTFLGQYIYLLIALISISIAIPPIVYSYTFFQLSTPIPSIISAESVFLGIQSFIGGLFFGFSFLMWDLSRPPFSINPSRGLILFAILMFVTFIQIYIEGYIYSKKEKAKYFQSTTISHTISSFLATFLIFFLFIEDIFAFSEFILSRIGYFLELTGICLIGGTPTKWITLAMSKKAEK
ncbi:MAG: hypothetical protein PVF58_14585 [Candidatus Methanofastidiosia archaeon]|jgi:hypothetical protein